ncbi:MAG: hypothetical protein CMM59_07440 [Rhodospirillaceae bacterium]|nr:hypothetical protein [Rhodospirillaceae bacterium]
MLKKIFSKKGKSGKPGDGSPATKAPIVDEDETIVINLTGAEKPPTEDISIKPTAQRETAAPETEVRLAVTEEPKLRLDTETTAESTPETTTTETVAVPTAHGDETVVLRTSTLQEPASGSSAAQNTVSTDVAGWLCVISEAMQGASYSVTSGRNTVGRAETNDLSIENDDAMISRETHMSIVADPKSQKFYLVPGETKNLTYLNGEPLLAPGEISDRDKIQIGVTEFIFVQYYGNYTDWR